MQARRSRSTTRTARLSYDLHLSHATTIDTFYTNADGYLVTPEKLPYGDGYSIVEVQAPYGYTLNAEPVYFNITPDGASTQGAA